MWLRSGMAVAMAYAGSCSSTGPLAWELPHAAGIVKKKKKERKKNYDLGLNSSSATMCQCDLEQVS